MDILFAIIAGVFIILWYNTNKKLSKYDKFKDIVDLDEKRESLKKDIEIIEKNYNESKKTLETLLKELDVVEIQADIQGYGLYTPQFNFDTSEKYKQQLTSIVNKLEDLIKQEKATFCATEWTIGGSKAEGKKMVKQASKLMLRAFNGESDAAIAKVKWNNISQMRSRIEKSFEAVNKMGQVNQISITKQYLELKLQELMLEFEYQEKLQEEKEEQRRIKEQMREEEKIRKEIEKAKKQAEDDEARYQKALEKAKLDMEKASGEQMSKLQEQIKQLEENLVLAQQQKERAISQAQKTRSGHVYVISNIGSFGENVFKIGMTRRLEPMDRVKELGDASVPFEFDVHAMIYSEDAPKLEKELHRMFIQMQMNKVNPRKEFFKIPLKEIKNATDKMKLDVHWTMLAEAKEYRESISIEEVILRDESKKSEWMKTQIATADKIDEEAIED